MITLKKMERMKKYIIGISSIIALLVIILGLSFVPWKSMGKNQKPIRVVTGLNFYGEVAQKVAGDHGQVISFIAALLPARRAANLNPIDALAAD